MPAAQQQPQDQSPRRSNSDELWNQNQNVNPVQPLPTVPARQAETITKRHLYPVLELISPRTSHTPSSSGKTSLIYLITALAILPSTIFFNPAIDLGGENAAIVILDPLSHFNVKRLAEVCISFILSKISSHEHLVLNPLIKETVKTALQHVHIFRPTSWPSLLWTLETLPNYLFDEARHHSMTRRIHSIVVEDVDAFDWDIRTTTSTTSASPLASASTTLTTALLSLSSKLSASILLTSHSGTTSPTSFRSPIPLATSWPPHVHITRLAVRRLEVLPFAPGISIEEAERERSQRWDVVKRGRFECWKVGGNGKVEKEGQGFVFRVGRGIEVNRDEKRA
jgi:hypothetical protein